MNERLSVTKVRYFATRRGQGYQCSTNIDGVYIWNDGDGSGTYIDATLSEYTNREFHNHYMPNIEIGTTEYEFKLENLINKYEGIAP